MSIRPVGQGNAIAACKFTLVFAGEDGLADDQVIRVASDVLGGALPSINELQHATFEAVPGSMTAKVRNSGFRRFSTGPDGSKDWEAELVRQSFSITCFTYTRWDDVAGRACSMFGRTLHKMQAISNPLQLAACVLTVVDKFVHQSAECDHPIDDVFDANCEFLTPQSRKSGRLWHVHQGWFESAGDQRSHRALHTLNLSSRLEKEDLVTTIEHSAHTQYLEGFKFLTNSADVINDSLLESFHSLHIRNKEILRQSLSIENRRTIGLD